MKRLYAWRHWLLVFSLAFIVCALVFRLFQLMVSERSFLLAQGNARVLRLIKIPAYRGMITDRSGEPLAISTPVVSVWANPQRIDIHTSGFDALSNILEITPHDLRAKIQGASDREFVYLKRGLPPTVGQAIRALQLKGIGLEQSYRRYYPDGAVFSQILGFTNLDDAGQEGLEAAYDYWLEGKSGLERVIIDRLGRVVADVGVVREPKPGNPLVLSIDRRIQYLAYRALCKAMKDYQPKSASAVVLDVKTGEILAMVNQPSFNPNNWSERVGSDVRNRAVTDVFEPGSTIKAFSVASALMSGKYTPDSMIDTSPGWLVLNGKTVRDAHNNQTIDVTTILQRSSNVGVTKLTLSLPAEHLTQLLETVGFGRETTSGFPGESAGVFPRPRKWSDFGLATLSFGYGLSVTCLQLAHAYAILAADGEKYPVTFLKQPQVPTGKQVIPKKIAKDILLMLQSVIEKGGTATAARVPGYHVTGKTGTVRIVGAHGYQWNHHIGMFVGAAPATHPRLVIAVIINDPAPGKPYYGGLTAAPVFAEIMAGSLRLLDIPPDYSIDKQTQK